MEEAGALSAWLETHGAMMLGLQLRHGGVAGRGIFAARAFGAGEVLCELPQRLVLTVDRASDCVVGQAALQAGASQDVAAWLSIAWGAACTSHAWHPYLRSLPSQQPDPSGWPEGLLRQELRGTDLLARVQAASSDLKDDLEQVWHLLPAWIRQVVA
ncbi:unnamed protein product [Prorocentrum cordatum]|uniref:Uncharacterized protein n=1 Tax=Prorocentrum cordatum TaxID=2364126 RepID=A0ABN9UU94_9DINO|nr:unnamed protein product [Polarella glacialis]